MRVIKLRDIWEWKQGKRKIRMLENRNIPKDLIDNSFFSFFQFFDFSLKAVYKAFDILRQEKAHSLYELVKDYNVIKWKKFLNICEDLELTDGYRWNYNSRKFYDILKGWYNLLYENDKER